MQSAKLDRNSLWNSHYSVGTVLALLWTSFYLSASASHLVYQPNVAMSYFRQSAVEPRYLLDFQWIKVNPQRLCRYQASTVLSGQAWF
ncbi:hypothetical protein AV530_011976 [Patagioenas fasciata monilis]|uniref:Uncharacterized protein n=1 Tax=Patagioenas fasciata monilis TaxID=372326 RepID=A0A1V4JUV1_PATFA|nr:hypothetical protein AV530_011976 [Patagioenas fasciata monilis]